MRYLLICFLLIAACSPKVQAPPKPSWLGAKPFLDGYYTGIGHSVKDGSNNYVQAAKRSALDDLVSEIKVQVSSTSVLSQLDVNKEFSERYEQIIQTTAKDEIEEFELVETWEDGTNYWVYYRLSKARYRQIKEEQKRNATVLSTDFLKKAREAEKNGERLQALNFYFQALRAIEKYLADAIRITLEQREVLLVNEIYASIQLLLDRVNLKIIPAELSLNRRLAQAENVVLASAIYKDTQQPVKDLPLKANFEKGKGDVFPDYKIDEKGEAKILINKIQSRELEQTVVVKVNIDALSGSGNSPVYVLIAKTFNVPQSQVILKVQRPVAFLEAEEKSLGSLNSNTQVANKLRNLLANAGFEFTDERGKADLWVQVKTETEKGSVSGSIYVTYLNGTIKVGSVKENKEIYTTTFDRLKGYGLDYDKSSVDAYNKTLETLEKERMQELLNNVLQ